MAKFFPTAQGGCQRLHCLMGGEHGWREGSQAPQDGLVSHLLRDLAHITQDQ